MNCSYHSQNPAAVSCNGCGRPLCAACDHRIKGYPYCEDCIVEGVGNLRGSRRNDYSSKLGKQTYPFVALILSWVCPGLGAAYNGQMVKALVHFGIVAGLFQMAVSTGMAMFIIGLLGMWWFFLPLDAWRSAKLLRAGVRPQEAEDVILERLTGNARLSAVLLIGIGSLFLLHSVFGTGGIVRGVLPILLIGFGLYLVKDLAFGRKPTKNEPVPDWETYRDRIVPQNDVKHDKKSSWRN
jgi:hypothetical protein